MKYKKTDHAIIVTLGTGENLLSSIASVCEAEQIGMGTVIGVGGAKSITFAVWNNQTDEYDYLEKTNCNMEIISLSGNISWLEGEPNVHLHAAVADSQFQVCGGHVMDCVIQNLAEIYLYPGNERIQRVPFKHWFFMDI